MDVSNLVFIVIGSEYFIFYSGVCVLEVKIIRVIEKGFYVVIYGCLVVIFSIWLVVNIVILEGYIYVIVIIDFIFCIVSVGDRLCFCIVGSRIIGVYVESFIKLGNGGL